MVKLRDRVFITGVGCTPFGDLLSSPSIQGLSLHELTALAAQEALDDAGMSAQDIDAIFAGNAMVHSSQLPGTYSQLSKWLGMELKAGVHFEAQCSTTSVGAVLAAMAIAAGVYDHVLVVGFETTLTKVKGLSPYERERLDMEQTWLWTDCAVNQAYSVPQGYDIFSVYNGLVAQGYCRKYGISIEEYDRGLFEICRTRRLHGSMTSKAILQETLEDEAKRFGYDDPYEFWKSTQNPFLAWPTRMRSLVTTADGASAIVVSRGNENKNGKNPPIEILGFGISQGDLPWYGHDPTRWPLDQCAFDRAYEMAGITGRDIRYLHTHDCSHISGICTAELSGFLPEGQTLKYAEEGRLRFDGDRPMSTHGGRHAFGHAWAASAGSDIYEAVKQMRSQSGPKQINPEPELSVIHTHGYAMIATVVVLRRE